MRKLKLNWNHGWLYFIIVNPEGSERTKLIIDFGPGTWSYNVKYEFHWMNFWYVLPSRWLTVSSSEHSNPQAVIRRHFAWLFFGFTSEVHLKPGNASYPSFRKHSSRGSSSFISSKGVDYKDESVLQGASGSIISHGTAHKKRKVVKIFISSKGVDYKDESVLQGASGSIISHGTAHKKRKVVKISVPRVRPPRFSDEMESSNPRVADILNQTKRPTLSRSRMEILKVTARLYRHFKTITVPFNSFEAMRSWIDEQASMATDELRIGDLSAEERAEVFILLTRLQFFRMTAHLRSCPTSG